MANCEGVTESFKYFFNPFPTDSAACNCPRYGLMADDFAWMILLVQVEAAVVKIFMHEDVMIIRIVVLYAQDSACDLSNIESVNSPVVAPIVAISVVFTCQKLPT